MTNYIYIYIFNIFSLSIYLHNSITFSNSLFIYFNLGISAQRGYLRDTLRRKDQKSIKYENE